MATDRKLRNSLLAKLKVTPQRMSQKIAGIKKQYGPMSTEDGTYLLAHNEGLDLSKFLARDTVDRIRGMVGTKGGAPALQPARKGKSPSPARTPVRIGRQVDATDPLLPPSVIADAKDMAEIYPHLYILENSIRGVISH